MQQKNLSKNSLNFPPELTRPGMRFLDARTAPIQIYGVFYEDGRFRRMPRGVAEGINEGVLALHANTAGGRARFSTDSPYLALHAITPAPGRMPHFAFTGSAGFDVYVNNVYYKTFLPSMTGETVDGVIDFADAGPREITVHFPLYSDVTQLYFGLSEGCALTAPAPYKDVPPVVYYGSSITQGGCASRPGLAYQNILTRMLNTDHVNLGFSGNAKGEPAAAQYIAGLTMSVFVFDYDHNAPDPDHLRRTHEPMFKTVRAAHPTLPVVFMSRPKFVLTPDEEERLAIITQTYENARAAGDDNVYLLPGPTLTALCECEGTVDDCHPNDLGFYSMARALYPVLKQLV